MTQFCVVRDLMLDNKWRSLSDIQRITGYPQCSISAHLRSLRKARFGSYIVEKKYVSKGLWLYRVHNNTEPDQMHLDVK